jgi:Flp pilus assembly protein TadD
MFLSSSIKHTCSKKTNRCGRRYTPGNQAARWGFIIGLMFLSACASMPARQAATGPAGQDPEYPIVSGIAMAPEFADDSIPDADILLLGKEVTALLDDTVMPMEDLRDRLDAIIAILNDKVRFDTASDTYATKTAMETYETGTGNCLSFANLFVAMARHVGLEAGYQEVSTRPNWNREKGIIFVSKHISAYATIRAHCAINVDLVFFQNGDVMIQINSQRERFAPLDGGAPPEKGTAVTTTPVPDHRAFAQYYNNIAAMHLAEGDASTAFRYFTKALWVEPELDFVWSNLGVAYSREHRLKAAEEAYLHALSIAMDAGDITALSIMNNMVKLYERSGDEEKADFFRNEVAAFRDKNPYYHYLAGQSAYSEAAYEESIKHFKAAIKKKQDDDMFYYSLALAYLRMGDLRQAEKNIDKARRCAWDDQTKAYYAEVLEEISHTALN